MTYLWPLVKLHEIVNLHQHGVLLRFFFPSPFAFTVTALAQNVFVTKRAVTVRGLWSRVDSVRG